MSTRRVLVRLYVDPVEHGLTDTDEAAMRVGTAIMDGDADFGKGPTYRMLGVLHSSQLSPELAKVFDEEFEVSHAALEYLKDR